MELIQGKLYKAWANKTMRIYPVPSYHHQKIAECANREQIVLLLDYCYLSVRTLGWYRVLCGDLVGWIHANLEEFTA